MRVAALEALGKSYHLPSSSEIGFDTISSPTRKTPVVQIAHRNAGTKERGAVIVDELENTHASRRSDQSGQRRSIQAYSS
ncbi:MAG: hypothetical protein IPP42_04660 [Saprospiraceae bacterium]|nr:hypothetical protein [Saprospiraceae bacterium]